MLIRGKTGLNVFDQAIERIASLYADGHRLVVSFSGGKDSNVTLEMALIAARMTDRLPVDVVMRDDEILYPGSFEYCERVAEREEFAFRWVVARQPILNIYNRAMPYYWAFDPELEPKEWVREPPERFAEDIPELNIRSMTLPSRFPPAPGKRLYSLVGMRSGEGRQRRYAPFAMKGYVTKPNKHGVSSVWPIFDWTDGDIWKAIGDNRWDYNRSYDVMHRMGVSRWNLRIAPPCMNAGNAKQFRLAAQAWPRWFERVADRLPGVRQVINFGDRVLKANRRLGETWEQCYYREVLGPDAPEWIRERGERAMRSHLSGHKRHSTTPFPEVDPCQHCPGNMGSWRTLTAGLWDGDPMSLKARGLPYIEPEFFRPGAGKWGGPPSG